MSDERSHLDTATAWLTGGGEMGERLRGFDWASTPLGPAAAWPQSLRSAVSILLPSKAQICLFWGPELIKLYNDAYIPVLGRKHPGVLGRPAREVWSEIWDVLGPLLGGVIATGEAFRAVDHPFYLDRRGFAEETYFDVSYDPVRDETGKVGGVFCIVGETTGRVLSERRLRTLRDLGHAKEGRSAAEACRLALTALASSQQDVPFVSLHLLEPGGTVARGLGAVGVPTGAALSTGDVDMADPRWSFGRVAQSGQPLVLASLPPAAARKLPETAAPDRTLVLPIVGGGQCSGFVVAGTSRFLALEGDYRDFFDLVAAQIGTAVTHASSYEEERKRAEALAELDRAKTRFFSNVSHEFRTPLTLMLGPLEDLLGRAPSTVSSDDHATLALIHRNGRRLLKLVNTLLDFSRIQAGRNEALYEPTDLAALTADVASVFRSAVEQAGLAFDVRCAAGLEPIYVDRGMWEKIVLNLLSNAFKFTFEGRIAVELADRGAGVELVVRDTGIGIAPGEIGHLFERFHRVEGVRARTHEGSGIGLALVQELVQLHGGTVRVESQPGQGSAFFITLPKGRVHLPAERVGAGTARVSIPTSGMAFLEEARRWLPDDQIADEALAAAPAPEPGGPTNGPRRARVVVADDNADMREYLARLLRAHWDVAAVGDGHAALASIRARPADLVLTDVMMPRLGGFELLRALRADPSTRDLPVILLSARAGEESRVEGLQAGADDYVIKPFSARELVARVEAHLKLKALREDMQGALRESEARFREMADHAPVLTWVTGRDGACTFLSRPWVEFTGQAAEAGLGAGWLDAVHPEDRDAVREARRTAHARPAPFGLEYRLRRHDGEYRWVIDSASPRLGAGGELRGYIGSAFDITDRKRAEAERQTLLDREQAARREAEEKTEIVETINRIGQRLAAQTELRPLVQSFTDEATRLAGAQFGAFFYNLVDEQGESYTPYTISGVPRAEFEKFPLPRNTPLFGPTFRGERVIRLDDVKQEPRYGGNAPHHGMPRGHLPVTSYLAVPVVSRTGEVIGGLFLGHEKPAMFPERLEPIMVGVAAQLAIAIDNARLLDKEQRARAAAEDASRAKDEFLAVLSHELRTPLNAVYGWARMLRSGEIAGEAVPRALDVIMRNANAQVQLIDDMLDVSRIVTGKMRLDVRPVDLKAVVEAALDVVRPAAEAKDLRLQAVLDAQAFGITGDPDRLQQVVWNLLINAVKFTPRGGRIQVHLRRANSHVEIIVSDSGQGMAPAVLPHVFERFQQGDSTSTRRHTGLGLGLALVRHLVELHGGTVEASSPGQGQGSTFIVKLPVAIARAGEADEASPARGRVHPTAAVAVSTLGPSLRGLRVLIVDDDRDGLDLVATMLINGGAEVRTGTSAAEGLETLQAWRPDVLISDIEMPGEDGYTFIRRVRALDTAKIARTPAVALTAYGRVEDRLRTLSAGYSMHVPKPVDPAELATVVASLVGRT
ncbi:MAG TPA: ATP-binding protein [Candidatus Acidoferrum sp.]|nr:ATP-binding protein [Candidatus Acidoferrum sp.]